MSLPSQDASPKPSARVPRLRRGQTRVSSLLAAAASVIATRGYDATTMTEIAAEAGASIGSLYQFFPTKVLVAEALHLALLEALSARIDALAVATPPGSTLGERSGMLFDGMVAFMAEHPAFIPLAERRDIDPARKKATRADLLERIGRLVAAASPPPARPRRETVAVLVLTMMKAAVSLRATEGDTPSCRRLVAELRAMLTERLAAAEPAARTPRPTKKPGGMDRRTGERP